MGSNIRKLNIVKSNSDNLSLQFDDILKLKVDDGAVKDAKTGFLLLAPALLGSTEILTNNALVLYEQYDYEIVTYGTHKPETKYLIITKKK